MKIARVRPIRIQGLRPLPLLGSLGSLLRFFRDPIECMRTVHRRFGAVAAVSENDPSLVCAFGAEYNKQVLSNPARFQNVAELPIRVPEGTALRRLGTILVGMNGEQHVRLRRMMQPLFQKTHLDVYRDTMVEAVEDGLRQWRVGASMDVSRATDELSLRLSFRCLFGLEISAESRTLADMGMRFIEGATSPALIILPYDLPGTPYRVYMRLCEDLESRLCAMIAERRARPQARGDVLSVLIAAHDGGGAQLPDGTLAGLANELFIAGHKTTASTLSWILFLLDRHPRILCELVDELTGILRGDAPTVDQLDKLPYLDAVVKEGMRLLPASPFLFFRRVTGDTQLGPCELPAGATLVLSPLITHHMEEVYDEPLRFRPERWRTAEPSPYEYLPWGAGPRTCLGAAFASVSVRVMLSLILQRFQLSLLPGAPVSYKVRGTIMGTKHGLPMLVHPRGERSVPPAPFRGNLHELIDVP